jgi:hypothetical protein
LDYTRLRHQFVVKQLLAHRHCKYLAKSRLQISRTFLQNVSQKLKKLMKRIIMSVVTQIHSIVILLLYALQITFISLILNYFNLEFLSNIFRFILTCWLYAYYAFEYRMAHAGVTLNDRIKYFEDRWAYMLGFGLPNALTTYFFPFFINNGVWALLFPLVRFIF